jgi:membrane carboxypeptidase/penicillin-binding protein
VAVPIWTAFMKEALQGSPVEDFPVPEGVVLVPVDLSVAGTCARPVMMAFIAGTEPKNNCGPNRGSPKPDSPPADSLPPAATPAAPTPTISTTTGPREQGQ